jgi:hypothetical protein
VVEVIAEVAELQEEIVEGEEGDGDEEEAKDKYRVSTVMRAQRVFVHKRTNTRIESLLVGT